MSLRLSGHGSNKNFFWKLNELHRFFANPDYGSHVGFSTEELMMIPAGRRRKYHDDVTVIVIMLGNKQWTSTASTSL